MLCSVARGHRFVVLHGLASAKRREVTRVRRVRKVSPSVGWRHWFERELGSSGFRDAFERLAPEYEIARQLIELRRRCGLTQREAAASAGMSPPELAKIERGKVLPGLEKMAQVYGAVGYDLEVRPVTRSGRPAKGVRPVRIRSGQRLAEPVIRMAAEGD